MHFYQIGSRRHPALLGSYSRRNCYYKGSKESLWISMVIMLTFKKLVLIILILCIFKCTGISKKYVYLLYIVSFKVWCAESFLWQQSFLCTSPKRRGTNIYCMIQICVNNCIYHWSTVLAQSKLWLPSPWPWSLQTFMEVCHRTPYVLQVNVQFYSLSVGGEIRFNFFSKILNGTF